MDVGACQLKIIIAAEPTNEQSQQFATNQHVIFHLSNE